MQMWDCTALETSRTHLLYLRDDVDLLARHGGWQIAKPVRIPCPAGRVLEWIRRSDRRSHNPVDLAGPARRLEHLNARYGLQSSTTIRGAVDHSRPGE
jgi:hypothetical protein